MHTPTNPRIPPARARRAWPTFLAPLVLLLLALSAPAPAQAEVKVSARLSAGVLRMGDTAYLDLTIENGDDARILPLPAVEGLRLGSPGRPESHQFSSFVNGRVFSQRTLKYSIPIRAEKEGDFEIPSIAVEVGTQRFETRPLRVTVVKDITGADFGYLEVRASGSRVVEGQPFTVELTFGWDESRTGKVNYADLNLPWWDTLPGAIEVETPASGQAHRVTIPVNAAQVEAEQLENRVRDGRSFVTLHVLRTFLPTRSGTLEFPTSFLEFGRVVQDFFNQRRDTHFVQAPAFTLEVVPLPTEGQPLDFSGAVGNLSVRASADARDVRVGDSIKLTVEWTGEGNLQYFRAPDPGAMDSFRGFRVYGMTEEKGFDRRKVVYDLAPLSSEVQAIPELSLSVYDPVDGRYETLRTAPIPIRVRALEKETTLSDDERRFERDIADIDARAPLTAASADGSAQDRFLLGALVLVPLVGLVARRSARRRAGDPGAPLERRRRRAPRDLARALSRSSGPDAQRVALHEFLAARTREPATAWNGRDFSRWAEAHAPELPEEVRRGADEVLEGLDAALWGGGTPPPSERVLGVARKLVEAGL